METSIRSFNYASHGIIESQLTDRQIDAYALHGTYGRERQELYLSKVRDGSLKTFDALIRKGKFGDEAKSALNARPKRKTFKPTHTTEELTAMLLADLGLDTQTLLLDKQG